MGHVAVLADEGDLVIRRNPFDLDGTTVRFARDGEGGYRAGRLALLPGPPGPAVAVEDDGAVRVELGFAFPFFGRVHDHAFFHADGHLTFDGPDSGPGGLDLARVTGGGPRVAAFLANLDPSRGGSLSVRREPGRVAFVWTAVPGAGQINRNTFEAILHADGSVDLAYAARLESREALVGLVPGRGLPAPADVGEPTTVGREGVLERFSERERLDLVAVVSRFLRGHEDRAHQVVVYTTRPLNPVPGTLAFEINVKNEASGTGVALFDDSAHWGSTGALESVVYMDTIDQYLEHDGLEVLAHEVGHRWLARLAFRDAAGGRSDRLLAPDGVHWSFFLDSDASVMGGNAIADQGGGRFETVDIARRFSALDQYAMGLRTEAEVPPFFFVDAPDDFRPNRPYRPSSSPEVGVRFTGFRRDLRIADVAAAMGPRVPALGPRIFRQAYVLVEDERAPATEARVQAADRIRRRFEAFFPLATDNRGQVETLLH